MATMFFVQGFRQKGRKVEPDAATPHRSPEAAIAAAERLAPARIGVWAYAQNIDVETDSYDEPVPLIRLGTLPEGLGE